MLALFVKVNGRWRFEGMGSFDPNVVKAIREAVEKENGPGTFRFFSLEA